MSHANPYRCLIALSLLLPIPARAQTAFNTQAVNVRADQKPGDGDHVFGGIV